jgi:hypothetical protein
MDVCHTLGRDGKIEQFTAAIESMVRETGSAKAAVMAKAMTRFQSIAEDLRMQAVSVPAELAGGGSRVVVENDVEAMSTAIISVTTTVRRLGLIARTLRYGLPAVMPLCNTEDRHTPPQDRGAAEFKAIEQLEPEKRKQLELILGRRLIRSRSIAMMRIVPSSSTTAVCARHPSPRCLPTHAFAPARACTAAWPAAQSLERGLLCGCA